MYKNTDLIRAKRFSSLSLSFITDREKQKPKRLGINNAWQSLIHLCVVIFKQEKKTKKTIIYSAKKSLHLPTKVQPSHFHIGPLLMNMHK